MRTGGKRKLYDALSYAHFTFDCSLGTSAQRPGFVAAGVPYIVYIYPWFSSMPATGVNSRASALVFLVSMFDVVADTNLYTTGSTANYNLAQTNPWAAVQNADSYAYFAVNAQPPSQPPPPPPPPPPPEGSLAIKRDDYNRNGVSDVIGMRKSDGCLGRWYGNGNGGLDYAGDYGCGWNNYTDLVGLGDLNRNGVGDLVGIRKSDGCIARWYGNGNGGLDYGGDYGCGWERYTLRNTATP